MNIEVIDFFPSIRDDKNRILVGTLQVRLEIEGFLIDIRGINMKKEGDFWYLRLPYRNAISHFDGREISYPIFSFKNKQQTGMFIDIVLEKGKEFVLDFFKREALICSEKATQDVLCEKIQEIEKKESEKKILFKEWKDPPKLKNSCVNKKRKPATTKI